MSYATLSRHRPLVFALTLAAALVLGAAAAAAAATTEPPPKEPPPEAERSASGLVSLRLAEGSGSQPPDGNDFVAIHYTGWTPAGAKIDSSYDHGKPASILLERLSPGWSEGLQLMVGGEKRRLWIPAHLAPANPGVGPRGAVIFDIELLAIQRIPSPPRGLAKPPADAKRTAQGAFTKVIREGSSTEPTAETDPPAAALTHYTLWTGDGKVFDSSLTRNRPTLFPFDKVMPAFADCLRQMAVGEKRLIWIPGEIANGQWQGSPKGPLIFEVEVLRLVSASAFQQAVPQGG